MYTSLRKWSFSTDLMPRSSTNSFISAACFGIRSQIRTPGKLVAVGWNGPRYSTGASGFKSHMSMWLGPPSRTT